MSQPRLYRCFANNLSNRIANPNGNSAHRGPALVAPGLDPIQELLSVLDRTEEIIKPSRVPFSRITLKTFHKLVCEIQRRPLVPRHEHLRNRERHLSVIRITTRLNAM